MEPIRNRPRRKRAPTSGVILTKMDAARIRGMHRRGDRVHDIAAYHRVNAARICEIIYGLKFPGVAPMDLSELPPPGPYILLVQATPEQLRAALHSLH